MWIFIELSIGTETSSSPAIHDDIFRNSQFSLSKSHMTSISLDETTVHHLTSVFFFNFSLIEKFNRKNVYSKMKCPDSVTFLSSHFQLYEPRMRLWICHVFNVLHKGINYTHWHSPMQHIKHINAFNWNLNILYFRFWFW